jgi:hypothetical protein
VNENSTQAALGWATPLTAMGNAFTLYSIKAKSVQKAVTAGRVMGERQQGGDCYVLL